MNIIKDNKQKSGVYLVLNNINGNCYIGSAATNRINVRFRNHCVHQKSTSKPLYRAINKYGIENFSFHILEYFPGFVHKENLKQNHVKLLQLETKYIKQLEPVYNVLVIAGSSLGYKHTEETRLKMKMSYSQERKDFIANLNKGKQISQAVKAIMSQKAMERFSDSKYKQPSLRALPRPQADPRTRPAQSLDCAGLQACGRVRARRLIQEQGQHSL